MVKIKKPAKISWLKTLSETHLIGGYEFMTKIHKKVIKTLEHHRKNTKNDD